jgi:hypothetical protein
MRFRDPAEKHLQGDAPAFRPLLADAAPAPAPAQSASSAPRANPVIFYGALAIMVLALAGLVWVLTS